MAANPSGGSSLLPQHAARLQDSGISSAVVTAAVGYAIEDLDNWLDAQREQNDPKPDSAA